VIKLQLCGHNIVMESIKGVVAIPDRIMAVWV
jgi:hypothetical protein